MTEYRPIEKVHFAMTPQFSTYLDLTRFVAALLVFLEHLPGRTGGFFWQFAGYGHAAVVYFFVLSGLVIAFVTCEKKETLFEYAVNRLSRIYSVALPALLLTVAVYYFIEYRYPNFFVDVRPLVANPFWTVFVATFFLNECWFSTRVFCNPPYWSLGYEVNYYVFYGVLMYARGWHRVVISLCVLMLMGPSIIWHLPVWLAGAVCFKVIQKKQISSPYAITLFLFSVFAIIAIVSDCFELRSSITTFTSSLGTVVPTNILEDYAMGAAFAIHFFAFHNLSRARVFFFKRVTASIHWLASHTFSIYLYHLPILYMAQALFPPDRYQLMNLTAVIIVTPLLIFLLAIYTEKRKDSYRAFFRRVFQYRQPHIARSSNS